MRDIVVTMSLPVVRLILTDFIAAALANKGAFKYYISTFGGGGSKRKCSCIRFEFVPIFENVI